MKFRNFIKIYKILSAVIVILSVLGYFIESARLVFGIIMIGLLAAGLVVYLIFGRCRSCGKILSLNHLVYMKYCPFCSKDLYE